MKNLVVLLKEGILDITPSRLDNDGSIIWSEEVTKSIEGIFGASNQYANQYSISKNVVKFKKLDIHDNIIKEVEKLPNDIKFIPANSNATIELKGSNLHDAIDFLKNIQGKYTLDLSTYRGDLESLVDIKDNLLSVRFGTFNTINQKSLKAITSLSKNTKLSFPTGLARDIISKFLNMPNVVVK